MKFTQTVVIAALLSVASSIKIQRDADFVDLNPVNPIQLSQQVAQQAEKTIIAGGSIGSADPILMSIQEKISDIRAQLEGLEHPRELTSEESRAQVSEDVKKLELQALSVEHKKQREEYLSEVREEGETPRLQKSLEQVNRLIAEDNQKLAQIDAQEAPEKERIASLKQQLSELEIKEKEEKKKLSEIADSVSFTQKPAENKAADKIVEAELSLRQRILAENSKTQAEEEAKATAALERKENAEKNIGVLAAEKAMADFDKQRAKEMAEALRADA